MSSLGPIPQRLALVSVMKVSDRPGVLLTTSPCIAYISRGNTGGLHSRTPSGKAVGAARALQLLSLLRCSLPEGSAVVVVVVVVVGGGLAAAPGSGPAVFDTVLARRLEPPLSRPLMSVRLRVTRIL